jgi:hypothetical protein
MAPISDQISAAATALDCRLSIFDCRFKPARQESFNLQSEIENLKSVGAAA